MIFHEMIYYRLYVDQNLMIQCIRYADSLPIRQAAEYMCNDVLSYNEHNYLNLLRERYNINEADFLQIMSGKSLHDKLIKTPAGYGREQNIRLLVQMVVARYYLMPKKVYSNRFSTDCYSEYFRARSLKTRIGMNDYTEYEGVKATTDELKAQHSYFINDLEKNVGSDE